MFRVRKQFVCPVESRWGFLRRARKSVFSGELENSANESEVSRMIASDWQA